MMANDGENEGEEGLEFAMWWNRETVPLDAIERALYALADRVTGEIAPHDASWRVNLHAREHAPDVGQLADRLRQEVTDQTLRVRIAERTDPVRNLIFALAFSRTGLVDAQGDS